MEQMYLIEIFIDKVTIFATEEDESSDNKSLIIKVNFGPKVQFIVKENQLAVNEKKDDIIECDESGRRQWTRTIRTGKSYLFPSYPDSILNILSKFPLEIEIWNDEQKENETEIFVGVGNMHWDTKFFHMLKDTSEPCKIHEPLSIKSKTTLWAECCCKPAGEIYFILRISALGESIITEFQQLMSDPDSFVFRTNKAPSMFQCKRVEGDDPNFNMVGSLYETTTLEDPDVVDKAQNKIEICTELQSCGLGSKSDKYVCEHPGEDTDTPRKKYAIDKIRMGDITGPCGNPNCALAHKVRTYIRSLESYKGKVVAAGITDSKPQSGRKICGTCICKDDRWHRDECPEEQMIEKVKCMGCEGMTKEGHTCKDRQEKMYGTGFTPKTSETKVGYVFNITKFPDYKKGMFGQDTIVEDCFYTKYNGQVGNNISSHQNASHTQTECSCNMPSVRKSISKPLEIKVVSSIGTNNPMVYNLETTTPKMSKRTSYNQGTSSSGANNPMTYNVGTNVAYNPDTKRKMQVYNCVEVPEEKDCRCNPVKPSPPCRTFDCDCLVERENIAARKTHRQYCPSYKHKTNCPVTMMHEEEEQKLEDDEDETTPLPYGLPPIQLGPCPIIGRPCTVPDGFARMYKNALLPTQPYSYDDEGKVCCSKEYERIKKAIREYMRNDKGNDFRCINKFNVDTERRCCDKEQVLMALEGKACCGSHKMAIQEKYAEEKKQPPPH